jgi:site-specific DNA recombinase
LRNSAYKGAATFGKMRSGPRRAPAVRPSPKPTLPKRTISLYRQPEDQWVKIPVPAIVSQELFSAVENQLAENRKRARERIGGTRTLLRSLLVCGKCGYAVCAVGGGRYRYYRCNGNDARRFGGQRMCQSSSIAAEWLEDAVWADVQSLLAEPERIQREFERRLQAQDPNSIDDEIVELERSKTKLDQKLNRLLDAFAEGLIEKTELGLRSERIRAELKSVETRLEERRLEHDASLDLRLVVTRVEDFATRLHVGLEGTTWEQKRDILRLLVKQVEVDETQIRVVYRIPSGPRGPSPRAGSFRHCGRRRDVPLHTLAGGDATVQIRAPKRKVRPQARTTWTGVVFCRFSEIGQRASIS